MHFSTVVGNNFCVTGFPPKLHSTVIYWQQNTVLQGNYKEIFKVEIDSEKNPSGTRIFYESMFQP